MANESGSDDNLCFFITRIGEEGSPEREQADGVTDAIVKPTAKARDGVRSRRPAPPAPGQITTQIDRIVNAKMVVADLTGGNPNVYYELASAASVCRLCRFRSEGPDRRSHPRRSSRARPSSLEAP